MTTIMSCALLGIFMIATFAQLVLGGPLPEMPELDIQITHTGKGTWFHPALGNCGFWNVDSDHIVSIPKSLYDENNGSNCNQWVRVTDTDTGKTAYGLTRDSCAGCGLGDLDMSPSLFGLLAPLTEGVISVQWNFMAQGWEP